MRKKAKISKPGTVSKIIKPAHPSLPEKAEIVIHEADDLYREIRIDNCLEDGTGKDRKLKEGAVVDVVIEANKTETVPKDS